MKILVRDKEFTSRENLVIPYGIIRNIVEACEEDFDLTYILTKSLPQIKDILRMNFSGLTEKEIRRIPLSQYAQIVIDFMTEVTSSIITEVMGMKKGRQLELPEYSEDFSTVTYTHATKLCEMTAGMLEDVLYLVDAYKAYEKTKKTSISPKDIQRLLEDIEDMLETNFPSLDCYSLDKTSVTDILRVCITAFAYGTGLLDQIPASKNV